MAILLILVIGASLHRWNMFGAPPNPLHPTPKGPALLSPRYAADVLQFAPQGLLYGPPGLLDASQGPPIMLQTCFNLPPQGLLYAPQGLLHAPQGLPFLLHKGRFMLHRSCFMLHRGCFMLHRGCFMIPLWLTCDLPLSARAGTMVLPL